MTHSSPIPSFELARILRKIAERLDEDGRVYNHTIYDVNGNLVGTYGLTRD